CRADYGIDGQGGNVDDRSGKNHDCFESNVYAGTGYCMLFAAVNLSPQRLQVILREQSSAPGVATAAPGARSHISSHMHATVALHTTPSGRRNATRRVVSCARWTGRSANSCATQTTRSRFATSGARCTRMSAMRL